MTRLAAFRRRLARRGVPGFVPVLVYQMAKVGSSAVVDALDAAGQPVFHLHRMDREHLERMRATRAALGWQVAPTPPPHDLLGLELRDRLVSRGRRVRVITLVRDPIARNLSSYFEHLDSIWNRADAHASVSLDDLHRGFFERFPHDEPLTWFDDEFRPVLGVDVYDHPFPSAGTLRIGNDVLILKSEREDATKCAALSDFLGLRKLTMRAVNSTEGKTKGETYKRFVATIRLERGLVDRMLDSRYTRHFYSEAERDAMRRKYIR